MNVELLMLTYSAILAFVLVLIPATGRVMQYGLVAAMGNRDTPMPLSAWAERAERTYRNTYESLPVFTILVLVIHALVLEDPLTALGAQLFFWGRVAYAVVYIAGIWWIRTALWLVSVVGMGMLAYTLLGGVILI